MKDQNTIEEHTGKLQELQKEFDGMNDSRDFKDAESVRSGSLSQVPSAPASFPLPTYPGGLLSRPQNSQPKAGTLMVRRETFLRIRQHTLQHLAREHSVHGMKQLREEFLCVKERRNPWLE